MGSGGQNEQGPAASPQRRRRHHPPPAPDSGLDQPPSVTCPSLGHQPRSLCIRTPQHLCTLVHPPCAEESIPAGAAPCDPILAFGRYVVSATTDGRVCFYSISMTTDHIQPHAVVELDPHSTLVGLVATPYGVSLVRYHSTTAEHKDLLFSPPDLVGHLVAITSEGHVHLVECVGKEAKLLYSFHTGTCNPSCVTVRPKGEQGRMCVGYASGCLEEWQVSIPVRVDATNKDATKTTAIRDWKPLMTRASPQMLWRGSFDTSIRSISTLGMDAPEKDECNVPDEASDDSNAEGADHVADRETNEKHDTTDDGKEAEPTSPDAVEDNRCDFLAVCLIINPQPDDSLGRLASSSQAEVVNAAKLEREWKTLLEESDNDDMTRNGALHLDEYCVWPQAGMEILDTASLPLHDSEGQRRLSRRMRSLPSRGSDRLCAHDGSRPFFAAALSDGTIALMRTPLSDGSLTWGIVQDSDEVTLSFPAIGIAPVELSSGRLHVACCLRGGTVYLVPVADTLEPVTVILAPVDVEEQLSTQYLHGFHAGNLHVTGVKPFLDDVDLPVIVYSGAAGIMKVYSCELLSSTEEESLLRELVDNGSVTLLREMLCSLSDEDPLLILDLWGQSRKEFINSGETDPTFVMLTSESFVHTRRLLMELTEEDTTIKTTSN